MTHVIRIDPENFAYWYLRLNGFLTITNFVVHPDEWTARQTRFVKYPGCFPVSWQ